MKLKGIVLNETLNIKPSTAMCLLVYLICSGLLEFFSYTLGGVFELLTSRIWLFTGILSFVCMGYWLICRCIKDVKNKDFILVAGFFILLGFFFYFVGNVNYSDVNQDATQQMAAGINSFSQSNWNFTGSAFLGYPNRQYLLAALPSLLFGRSIFTLHLGFAIPFFFGLIMFYLGLREWCNESRGSGLSALAAVYSLLAFRFVTEYFMNFEQAITPISLTMILIGLFLKLCKKPDIITMVVLAWTCSYCAGSYTPVLASVGLLIVFLVLYILDIHKNKTIKYEWMEYPVEVIKCICFIIIYIIAVTVIILSHTTPIKTEQVKEEISFPVYCFRCIRDFFFDKDVVFFGGIGLVMLIYIVLALTFRLKLQDLLIALWVFAVVILANYMTGYTTYQKTWILQRTMIIIPVLIAGIVISLLPLTEKLQIRKYVLASLAVFTLTGMYNFQQVHQSFTYFGYVQPMKYMLSTATNILRDREIDECNLILYTDNQLIKNVQDYSIFLFPNAHTYTPEYGEVLEEIDFSLPTIIFSNEPTVCEHYDGDIMEYSYIEQRYDMKVTWYVVVQY